jgi:hypothetical protein
MCSGRFRHPQFPNRLDSRRIPGCDSDRPLMNLAIELLQEPPITAHMGGQIAGYAWARYAVLTPVRHGAMGVA